MSGHSKWASIKHKKRTVDAKRGKLFTKLARAIQVAAREALEDQGLELQSAELVMRPKTTTPVEESQVGTLMRLLEDLEDHDDVQAVHANFDVDAAVLERV